MDLELHGQTIVTHEQGHLALSAAVALGKYAYPRRGKMINESHAKGMDSQDRWESADQNRALRQKFLEREAYISVLKGRYGTQCMAREGERARDRR